MRVLGLFLFILVFPNICSIDLKKGESCGTPNKENGTCVPIGNCPEIKQILDNKESNRTRIEFARASLCGYDYDNAPLVCCNKHTYSTTPSPYDNIFGRPTQATTTTSKPTLMLEQFDEKYVPDRKVCGSIHTVGHIVGGDNTRIGEFPWMAAILFRTKTDQRYRGFQCGGSLISERYVLTAAHCLKEEEIEPFAVLLGEWQFSSNPDCYQKKCAPAVQNITIDKTITHNFYSILQKQNDIGLIRLETTANFTYYVSPICLPPTNLPPAPVDGYLTVAGWGRNDNGILSDKLQKADIQLVKKEECRKKLNYEVSIKEICAGFPRKDTCDGDSGGPLMRISEDKETRNWFIEGIVGHGLDCHRGVASGLTIYTRVSKFTRWILRTIAEQEHFGNILIR